jgi:hypothetical protein
VNVPGEERSRVLFSRRPFRQRDGELGRHRYSNWWIDGAKNRSKCSTPSERLPNSLTNQLKSPKGSLKEAHSSPLPELPLYECAHSPISTSKSKPVGQS